MSLCAQIIQTVYSVYSVGYSLQLVSWNITNRLCIRRSERISLTKCDLNKCSANKLCCPNRQWSTDRSEARSLDRRKNGFIKFWRGFSDGMAKWLPMRWVSTQHLREERDGFTRMTFRRQNSPIDTLNERFRRPSGPAYRQTPLRCGARENLRFLAMRFVAKFEPSFHGTHSLSFSLFV